MIKRYVINKFYTNGNYSKGEYKDIRKTFSDNFKNGLFVRNNGDNGDCEFILPVDFPNYTVLDKFFRENLYSEGQDSDDTFVSEIYECFVFDSYEICLNVLDNILKSVGFYHDITITKVHGYYALVFCEYYEKFLPDFEKVRKICNENKIKKVQ